MLKVGKLQLQLTAKEKYPEAEKNLLRARQILETSLGTEHIKVAQVSTLFYALSIQVLRDLAQVYEKQGKYREAEELYQKALSIQKEALGETHPAVAER
jgi:tetratricopeptide (TPR) repeat protein